MIRIYIKKAVIMTVLMISGCVSLSVDERFELAAACQIEGSMNCQELWDDWDHGVRVQERRDAERKAPCAQGYVLYCDKWCSKTKRREAVSGICVPRNTLW